MKSIALLCLLMFSLLTTNLAAMTFDASIYVKLNKSQENDYPNFQNIRIDDNFINVINASEFIHITNFPLSDSRQIHFDLKKTPNVFDSKTRFFKGPQRVEMPDFRTFTGTINGMPDSKVVFTVSRGMLFGMFSINNDVIYLSPSQDSKDEYIITDKSSPSFPRILNGNDTPDSFDNLMKIKNKMDSYDKPLSKDLLELELALETDTEFFKATGSDYNKANAYVLTLLTQMNMIYKQCINVQIKLTWLKIWTDNPSDPYDAKGDYATLRDRAVPYWKANYQDVERDLYHVCTAINYGGGGFGYFDALCGKKEFGMSVTSLQGWNNLPTFDFSYDLYILCHEIGHNFNAQHTHSCFWNNAPLDTCVVDNACLPPGQKPLPNPGSIMSYCGGINNESGFGYRVRMIFLDGNVALMRKTAELAACLDTVKEPVLTLLTPHGSEQFSQASTIDINWKAYNTEKIDLYFSTDSGNSWSDIARNLSASDENYKWILPSVCSGEMFVRISSADNSAISSSNLLPFTVKMEDPDGLVAHYPFNGNSNDEQFCHFYDAVNVNDALLTTDRQGNPDAAYLFTGGNYLKADNFDMSFDSLTVSFWFMLNNTDGKQNLVGSNYAEGWVFDTYYWGQFGSSLYVDGKGVPDQIWGGWLQPQRWYFAALTFDGTRADLYVDGILKGEKVWDSTVTLNRFWTPLYIGSRKDADFMNGKIDDIRIYKRALTQSEIMGLTGVDENKINPNSAQISISPIPATDHIEISLPHVILSEAKDPIRIYNTLGECVIKVEQTSSSVQRIDVSHLSPGVYFVRLGDVVRKFVKF